MSTNNFSSEPGGFSKFDRLGKVARRDDYFVIMSNELIC